MSVITMQIEPTRFQSALPTVRLRSSAASVCPRQDAFGSVAAWTYPETGTATLAQKAAPRISGIQGVFQGTSVVIDMGSAHVQAKAFDLQHQGSAPGGPPR